MFTYCANCGKRNDYDIKKPKFCSGCGVDFADAFKVKNETVAKKVINIDSDEDDYELIRVKKKKKINRNELAETKSFQELEAEEFSEDEITEDEKKSLAQEIKGSLDESDVTINFGKEREILNFKDIYAEAKRRAEQQQ